MMDLLSMYKINKEMLINAIREGDYDDDDLVNLLKNLSLDEFRVYVTYLDNHTLCTIITKFDVLHTEKITVLYESLDELSYYEAIDLNRMYQTKKFFKKVKSLEAENLADDDLRYFPNLQELHCGFNNNLTDEGLRHLPNLKVFYCAFNNNFTDEGLRHLPNLQELHCGHNTNFTDEGLRHVSRIYGK